MRWMESPPPATPGAVVAPSSCHRSDSCCRGRRTASPGLRRSPLRNLLWWVVAASVAAAVRGPAPWGATVVAVERPSDRQPVAPFPPATAAGTTGGAAVAAGPAPLGRLHTLPSLVCDVDAPASRGGGRGFWFTSPSEYDRGGARVWVPRGNGTCDAPFTDTSMMELEGISTGSSSPGGACVTKRNRRSGSYRSDDLRPKGARWASVRDTQLPLSADHGAMLFEREAVRILTLMRNSFHGGVARRTGVFDVLAVSRVTLGVCIASRSCDRAAAALDIASGRFFSGSGNADNISSRYSLVTYRDAPPWPPIMTPGPRMPGSAPPTVVHVDAPSEPVEQPPVLVSDTDEGLLSLGRSVLADPSRLSLSPAWHDYLRATVVQRLVWGNNALPRGLEESTRWSLQSGETFEDGIASTAPTPWLGAIAFVLCGRPAGSFLPNAPRLCGGLLAATPPPLPTPTAAASTVDGRALPVTPETVKPLSSRSVDWTLESRERDSLPVEGTPNLNLTLRGPYALPCWQAGVGTREVNPDSPDEVGLAERLGAITYRFDAPLSEVSPFPYGSYASEADALVLALSETYDRALFGVDPPEVPSSDAEVVLAVIVVLPELVALVVLLISTRTWRVRDLWVLLFVFLSGLVSMAGIFALAVRESVGDAWRAAAVRRELDVPHSTVRNGDVVVRIERLLVVVRTGYRAGPLWAMAWGMAGTYVAVSMGVAAAVWGLRRLSARRAVDGGRKAVPTEAPPPDGAHTE